MKKVLIIVHQETSDPGLVGQLLQAQGYTLDLRCPAIGTPLPDPRGDYLDHYAGAVVFGGPMSANDDQTLPFIQEELDWISIALESGKPYLGICLGAQLLARALGATVSLHPQELREIGYATIQPVDSTSPLAELQQVYHWHKEGFELPQGATLLASGKVFPNQAFVYGEAAYGVQFHPEITRAMIDRWTEKVPEQLLLPGAQSYERQIAAHDRHAASVERWLRGFLNQWLSAEKLAA